MTPREQEILTALENGEPADAIANRLAIKPSYVEYVAKTFDFRRLGVEMTRQERKIAASTLALEHAIRATGRLHS